MAGKRKEFAVAPVPRLVNPELWVCLFRALTDEFPTDLLGLMARYRSPVWINEWKHPPGMNRATALPHSEHSDSFHAGHVGHCFLWGPERLPIVTFLEVLENDSPDRREPYHWALLRGLELATVASCDRADVPAVDFRFGPAVLTDDYETFTSRTLQWTLDPSGVRTRVDDPPRHCHGLFKWANVDCLDVLRPKTMYRWEAKNSDGKEYVLRAGEEQTHISVEAGKGKPWWLFGQLSGVVSDPVRTGYMTNDGHHLACLLPGGQQIVVINLQHRSVKFFPTNQHLMNESYDPFPICVFNSYLYVLQADPNRLDVYDIESRQLEGCLRLEFDNPTGFCVCVEGMVIIDCHRTAESFVA